MIVDELRVAFLSRNPFWPTIPIECLEAEQQWSSFDWGVRAFRTLLPEIDSGNYHYTLNVLDHLLALSAAPLSETELLQEAVQWWHQAGRDVLQTAFSKFYATLAMKVRGDALIFKRSLRDAVVVVCGSNAFQPQWFDVFFNERLLIAIKERDWPEAFTKQLRQR